jgi:hypothetical protein
VFVCVLLLLPWSVIVWNERAAKSIKAIYTRIARLHSRPCRKYILPSSKSPKPTANAFPIGLILMFSIVRLEQKGELRGRRSIVGGSTNEMLCKMDQWPYNRNLVRFHPPKYRYI